MRQSKFVLVALGAILIVPAWAQAQQRGTAGGSKAAVWNRFSQNYGPGRYVGGSYIPASQRFVAAPVVTLPAPVVDSSARLTVRVPANAQVWIDDAATTQSGTTREFVSPQLDKGGTYHFRASWMENGKRVEAKRDVRVSPGQRVTVDLRATDVVASPE
ncbi:MAG: TIGR03000 domain-containing protein [Gemmataceae bacterium]